MKKILILGGGFGGYYTAKGLEKQLKSGEAEVTLVDVNGMLVYQPFLPEVAGGSIEARHIELPLRRHLKKTHIVQAKVENINHAEKTVTVSSRNARTWTISYDILVVALGAVTKTFPTPGIAENAVGMKVMEEAVYVRNRIVNNISLASEMDADDPARKRLLTFAVIGGGFSGMESIAEMFDFASRIIKSEYPNMTPADLNFHLIEAAPRIMPELSEDRAKWVVKRLSDRGINFHLSTCADSAIGGLIKTSTGEEIDADLIIWTAGTKACPALASSDLPLDPRGRMTCNTKLQVVADGEVVEDAWGLGDATAVEDLSGCGLPDNSCAPTAQHAVRQAKQMAKNLVATLRGQEIGDYFHKNAGAVAGLGQHIGTFTSGSKKFGFNGWLAWMGHRFYHGFAMPSFERKFRIWGDWTGALILGRDTSSTRRTQRPRQFFEDFAVRPKEED